jgi:TonB-dependent receptor
LGAQFLNQVLTNQEYVTQNLAMSFEWAPSDTSKWYFDAIFNDQERREEGHRAQASNISRLQGNADNSVTGGVWTPGNNANFTGFQTYDLGTMLGPNGVQDLGSATLVTQGTFTPLQADAAREAGILRADGSLVDGRGAPFLRSSSDASSRLTDSKMFRFGNEFQFSDKFFGSAEVSSATSESVESNFDYTMNFINPNSFIANDGDFLLDGVTPDLRDENGTPYIFNLDGNITWGINFADPFAPTPEQLLDPANYVNDSGEYRYNTRDNDDTTFRADFTYDLDWESISSIDFGIRHNIRNSQRLNNDASWGRRSELSRSLNASYISDLLVPMPDNYGDGLGSDLFVSGLLMLNPELAASPEALRSAINAARTAQNADTAGISIPIALIGDLSEDEGEFFDIEETSTAIYAQANFEVGIFRGNAGFRYVETDLDSTANVDPGTGTLERTTLSNDYDFLLPRLNIVAEVHEDVLVRAAYSEDIRRPDFDSISAARTFPGAGGVNSNSVGGNPFLLPEEVESFDIGVEYYFAPASVVSLGYFNKKRSAIISSAVDQPEEIGGLRDVVGPECEGGGIFSPLTESGIFGNGETGVCVGNQTEFNTSETTTQKGWELAFQYDLSQFESTLGWASGFGILANYTKQEQDYNEAFSTIGGSRAIAFWEAQGFAGGVVYLPFQLLDLSEDAYNVTVYYEDERLSARMRYTWRDAHFTDELPGTGNVFTPLGGRGVVNARGQLNAGASYHVNDNITLSLEGINLTESDADVSCLNENALLCYRGITDRRITFGAAYRF